jgi:hypothetical protein
MGGVTRVLLAVLGVVALWTAAPAQESGKAPAQAAPKSILWNRTWQGALREASIRNVPIYILVSIGEG